MNLYVYSNNDPVNWINPEGLKKCPCGYIKTFDFEYFSACIANEIAGFELLGPSISAMKKFNKRWGARLVPGIGWGVSVITFLNGYATCDQKATKCIKKSW